MNAATRSSLAVVSSVGCAVCQRLDGELDRLERIHAEKVHIREDNWHKARRVDYGRLRIAENEAMLKLEMARAELKQHKRAEHGLSA